MQSQTPDSESLFVVIILVVAIFVFVGMLVALFALLSSEDSRKDRSTLRRLADRLVALFPGEPQKNDSEPAPVAITPAASSAQIEPKDMLTSSPLVRNAIGGILLTTLLMMGFILTLEFAYALIADSLRSKVEFWMFIFAPLVAASGGVAGARIAHASWRQIVLASLLSAGCLVVLSRFLTLITGYLSLISLGMSLTLNLFTVPVFLVILSAPVFLLPLFDPAVRRTGPAPTLWQIGLAAFCLVLFLAALPRPYSIFGVTLIILARILKLSAFLTGLGLFLSLVKPSNVAGAWVGGLGVLLVAVVLVAWLLIAGL